MLKCRMINGRIFKNDKLYFKYYRENHRLRFMLDKIRGINFVTFLFMCHEATKLILNTRVSIKSKTSICNLIMIYDADEKENVKN